MAAAGAAMLVSDNAAAGDMMAVAVTGLLDPGRRAAMSRSAQALARPRAAVAIAERAIDLVERASRR
jgi:UDP-N-acetylglucosamine:LPS N-acetylglucosamine transferase